MLHSFNTINLYKNCKFAYKLRYINNQKLPIKDFKTVQGIILHSFLQQYFTQPKNVDEDKYWKFTYNNKYFYIKKNYCNFEFEIISNIFKNEFLKIIQQGFFKKIENIKYKKLITELQIKNRYLIGTLDLYIEITDNKAIIIDYKSGNSYFSNMEQLYIYSILIFEKFKNINELMLVFYYFNDNKTIKHLFYRNEFKFFQKKLYKEIKEIEQTTEFEKNLDHCKICFYKETCNNYHIIVNNLKNPNKNFNSSNYLSKTVLLTNKEITDNNLFKYLILNINDFEKDNLLKILKKLNITKIICNINVYNKFTGLKLKKVENSIFTVYLKKIDLKLEIELNNNYN